MGFVMYFQVMSVSAQGESQITHPLSSDRVEAVARPAAFMDPREDPARFTSRILDAAETLRRTAHQLDQPDVRQNFEYLSKITSWENLATDLPLLLKSGACHT
jgi:hypothetical protein